MTASHAAPKGVEMLRAALQDSADAVERDHKIRKALPVLRADAIGGDAQAQYNLARLYETGVPSGPTRTYVAFPARAYAWYVAAGRQGHPMAQKRLAATGPLALPSGEEAPPAQKAQTAQTADEAEDAPPTLAPLSAADKTAMGLGNSYQLKIASFRNPANAAALVEILTEEGVVAMAHRRTDAASGEWHIVESAPLFGRREAEALAAGLKRNFGVDPQIKEISGAPSAGE